MEFKKAWSEKYAAAVPKALPFSTDQGSCRSLQDLGNKTILHYILFLDSK